MLDQRQVNLIKSIFIGGLSLIPIMMFFVYFIWPIQEIQMQEWIENSGCFNYIDGEWVDKKTCSVPHGGEFIYITSGANPTRNLTAQLDSLSRSRLKTWKS